MDSLYYNFDEQCDSCDLDCDSVYYVLHEAWQVLYVPCQGCGATPEPPCDGCDKYIPEVIIDTCYSWYDGCICEEELTYLYHAMFAEVRTQSQFTVRRT